MFVNSCGTSPGEDYKAVKVIIVFLIYSIHVVLAWRLGKYKKNLLFGSGKKIKAFLGSGMGWSRGKTHFCLEDLSSNSGSVTNLLNNLI